MTRLSIPIAAATLTFACALHAQDRQAVEQAATNVAQEWIRTWNAHDANAWAALFDIPGNGFVSGGSAWPQDSLKPVAARYMSQRTNESYTVDRAKATVLSDSAAVVQLTYSGRYTSNGQTWQYKSSAHITVLVQKRGDTWKITAAHGSGASTRVAQ